MMIYRRSFFSNRVSLFLNSSPSTCPPTHAQTATCGLSPVRGAKRTVSQSKTAANFTKLFWWFVRSLCYVSQKANGLNHGREGTAVLSSGMEMPPSSKEGTGEGLRRNGCWEKTDIGGGSTAWS